MQVRLGVFWVAVSVAWLASGSLSLPVHAQSAPSPQDQPSSAQPVEAAEPTGLEEVTVSARRVQESVERVPVAITAFTADRLQTLDNSPSLYTLNFDIPGIEVCCSVWNAGLTYVRGIPGPAYYFADVPGGPTGYANTFDVRNLEVLKGPQGTLFGQAAVAGAIVYEPIKPDTTFGGYFEVSSGDYDLRTVRGAVDLPIVSDRLFIRFAAISDYREGYIHDLSNNMYYGDENYYILRPSVIWKITDKLENYTLLQYSKSQDSGQQSGMWVIDDFNFNPGQPSLIGLTSHLNGGTLKNYYALAAQMLAWQLKAGPYTVIGTSSGCASAYGGPIQGATLVTSLSAPGKACPYDENKDFLAVNTTTYSVTSAWSIKNIFGYERPTSFTSQEDGDLSPLILLDFGNPKNTRATTPFVRWSDELQLHGSAGRFDVTAGLFYVKQNEHPGIVYGDFDTSQSATNTWTESDSRALYVNVDTHLDEVLPGLTATIGSRYNHDHTEQTSYTLDPNTNAVLGLAVASSQPAGKLDYSNVPYTAGLRYQATPSTMYFVTDSRGYSSGGFQSTPGIGTFQPQELNNLEAGIKSTFKVGNVTARVDASAYYGWFNDVQVQVWSSFNQPITGSPTVGFLTQNAATATIEGFDTDFTVVPNDVFEFGFAVAYTNDRYTKWMGINPGTGQPFDYSNTPFVEVPKWKGDVRPTVHLPTFGSWGHIDVGADYSRRSYIVTVAQPLTPTDPANPDTGLICTRTRTVANGYPKSLADGGTAWVMCQAPQENLDIFAIWHGALGHDNLTLSFHATNITGNLVSDSEVVLDNVIGFSARQPPPPRMFYATLTYAF